MDGPIANLKLHSVYARDVYPYYRTFFNCITQYTFSIIENNYIVKIINRCNLSQEEGVYIVTGVRSYFHCNLENDNK